MACPLSAAPRGAAVRRDLSKRYYGSYNIAPRAVPVRPPRSQRRFVPRAESKPDGSEWGAELPRIGVKQLQEIAAKLMEISETLEGAVSDKAAAGTAARAEEVTPEFSLSLAVGMARCAFESYLEPDLGARRLLQTASNGTQVTYISKEMLVEKMDGVLEVTMLDAHDLPPSDLLRDENDPYAILSLGQGVARTRTIEAVLVPEWNEKFTLYVNKKESDILRVRVFDEDFLKSDDVLGTAMLKVSMLEADEEQEFELPLQGQGGGGKVRFKACFKPFVSETEECRAATEQLLDEVASSVASEVVEGTPKFIKDNLDFMQESLGATLPLNLWNELSAEEANALENEADAKSKEMQKAWKNLLHLADAQAHGGLEPVAYVESPETDTQAWVFWNPDMKTVCLAFRGTEQVKWKDIVTDLNVVPMPFNVERASDNDNVLQRFFNKQEEPLVHQGFLNAWDSVRDAIFGVLDTIVDGDEDWTIYITGHSLGGALATICAAEMANRPKNANNQMAMYSFGAPRVGNTEFAKIYDRTAPVSWRIANRRDIVPTVPRLLGYKHVGQCAYLASDGSLEFATEGNDVFGEGGNVSDITGEVVNLGLEGKKEEVKGKLQQVYEHEMQILASLQDGSAISEHMEDLYLTSLESLLLASSQSVEA